MKERMVKMDALWGTWTLPRDEGGLAYALSLGRDDEGRMRFTLREERTTPGGITGENILEGGFELELDALVLRGENLHSSWQEKGEQREERTVYSGDPVVLRVERPYGMDTPVVAFGGPFKGLREGATFERVLMPSPPDPNIPKYQGH